MGKSIVKNFRNQYLTTVMIEVAMKNLAKHEPYSEWVAFNSPAGDSRVYSLTYNEQPITVSVKEQTDMNIEIRGTDKAIHLFIRELSAEIACLAIEELCNSLTKMGDEEIRENLRVGLLKTINRSLFDLD